MFVPLTDDDYEYSVRSDRVKPRDLPSTDDCDYVDRDAPMLRRMFEKRLRGYRAMGYLP